MGSHDVTGQSSICNQNAVHRGDDADDEPQTKYQTQQRTYNSQQLFAGTNEIGIEHGGQLYRLKITRQGKLILNK